MANQSWKHHYIPQFYLKNFTNSNNQFHIFLVKENRFKKNGKLFSPESHFFCTEGNTLHLENNSTDFLEKIFYKYIDDECSVIFDKIKASKERISDSDFVKIEYLVSHLFWRTPRHNKFVEALIKKEGLNNIGINIKSSVTNETIQHSKLEEQLIKNGSFNKIVKAWLPMVSYKEILKSKSILNICNFFPGQLPSLISDNPLILRNPNNFNIYTDDFILPINREKVIIRAEKLKSGWENQARILIDLVLVLQADTFIATTDLRYIDILRTLASDRTIIDIREELFTCFLDNGDNSKTNI